MKELDGIKKLINQGNVDEAISELETMIKNGQSSDDEIYYLLGNAYRKLGNWQLALNNYLSAVEINPDSPALQAKEMLMDILNFYNKDMYNQ